ncbi:MAG: universal stress protein [Myxococcales bacterium]|nr:universal stress protein [Myxococcales bacterium]
MTLHALPTVRGATVHDASIQPRTPRLVEAQRTLLAFRGDELPSAALRRAVQTSAALGHELHVLRVLPSLVRHNVLFPQRNVSDAFQALELSEKAVRSTRSWLLDALGDDGTAERLVVRTGGFEEATIAYAREIRASLVVVPAGGRRVGRSASTIACAIGKPVLVPKARGKEDTIVAATSLAEEGYPVLRRAARLGRSLGGRMVAVHNVVPFVSIADIASPFSQMGDTIASVLELRTRRLRGAARRMAATSSSVITVGLDSCRAILDEARTRDADIVVVGARPRSWVDRVLSSDLAADVVDKARRTVVVEPLDAAE